ncbi:ROK family protein [Paenibacillus sp. KQZ6P-2]|uniref:ROK family protein n=1 Tax=Paenibacillus mangrovi TaxID=2931978 RepID=A0A9X1WQN1_9BACL|nr:ROK family protein [Paenibacillus mangrovi]MCJ8012896.1 ROK family protein [Paenibacillus mangrovi]
MNVMGAGMKVIGIDIGGTSIKGMVLDGSGQLLGQDKNATEARQGKERILENIRQLLDNLLAQHQDIQGIGIGTAGRVNVQTGEIVFATDNLPGWMGSNPKAWVEEAYSLPVFVDNDANTALVGEAWLGAGRNIKDLSMLTLGTGVGGANMIGGELYRGAHWNGGEWGHTVLVPGGRPCNCGLRGCIEQYLSGTALVKLASEAAGRAYTSGVEVLDDHLKGQPQATQVLKQFSSHLAIVVNNLHIGLNPEAILIGGGLVDSKTVWWPLLLEAMNGMGLHADVRTAELGNEAGAIGAAKLVLDQLKSSPLKLET